MDTNDIKNKVEEVLDRHKVGTLATVQNGIPHSRYMTFHHENLVLYTATDKETHKAEDLRKNPNVHILIGYDGKGFEDPYVEVEGKAIISDSKDLKHTLWNDYMKHWFDGPEDPNYVVLEIHAKQFRLMNVKGEESPLILTPKNS